MAINYEAARVAILGFNEAPAKRGGNVSGVESGSKGYQPLQ